MERSPCFTPRFSVGIKNKWTSPELARATFPSLLQVLYLHAARAPSTPLPSLMSSFPFLAQTPPATTATRPRGRRLEHSQWGQKRQRDTLTTYTIVGHLHLEVPRGFTHSSLHNTHALLFQAVSGDGTDAEHVAKILGRALTTVLFRAIHFVTFQFHHFRMFGCCDFETGLYRKVRLHCFSRHKSAVPYSILT